MKPELPPAYLDEQKQFLTEWGFMDEPDLDDLL